eukprot:705687-Rhodomonas_salina.2
MATRMSAASPAITSKAAVRSCSWTPTPPHPQQIQPPVFKTHDPNLTPLLRNPNLPFSSRSNTLTRPHQAHDAVHPNPTPDWCPLQTQPLIGVHSKPNP